MLRESDQALGDLLRRQDEIDDAGRNRAARHTKASASVAHLQHHTNQVRELYRDGLSKSEVARRLNIGRTSVRRILSLKKS